MMQLRNGPQGYGVVTKVLHWLTVLAVTTQLVIGLTMDADAAADRADEQVEVFEEHGEEAAERRGEAAEERFEAEVARREAAVDGLAGTAWRRQLGEVLTGRAFSAGVTGLEAHLILGLLVLTLALVRLLWRRTTPLPPWAEHLSAAERKVEGSSEKALLALLVVVPVSGLSLVLVSDDLLVLHVLSQVALLLTVALHVGLVLKHTVVKRHRHLRRML